MRQTVSVIIPYYQSDAGILRKALNSILFQNLPVGWLVDVIVVDDGSPRPAAAEVDGLAFAEPIRLKIITQKNGGVARARNRGLDEADAASTLIAFLDSDDVWPENHLTRAIEAIDAGFDFYFTDNRREGYHGSHWFSPNMIKTSAFLKAAGQKTGFLEIKQDEMIELVLSEIPCQTSTVVHRRDVNCALRFNEKIKRSGEDVIYFTAVVADSNRICFDLDSFVECGRGINIYFSNFDWDNKNTLAIKFDILVAHRVIRETISLSPRNQISNNECIAIARDDVAFHLLRNIAKHPARIPSEIMRFLRLDVAATILLPLDMARLALSRASRVGRKPT